MRTDPRPKGGARPADIPVSQPADTPRPAGSNAPANTPHPACTPSPANAAPPPPVSPIRQVLWDWNGTLLDDLAYAIGVRNRTFPAFGLPRISLPFGGRTGTLIEADTAWTLAGLMAQNVVQTYGSHRFPNMDVCAKSGTAEVGGGKQPTAWFVGFLRNEDAPYAFAVVVEEGGSGAGAAGDVAARVLDVLVNGD